MRFPSIAAARRFDAAAHLPFVITGERFGWIRRRDLDALARWPDVFEIGAAQVTLAAALDTPDTRSMALASVTGALAADGLISGWRNEIYAIRNAFDAPPAAYIERAASRFFGTLTYAVHLNGIVEYAPAELAARAIAGRTVHVLCSLPEGTQAEQIFVYDLPLPHDFVPRNQDGEVAEHRLARADEVLRWLESGAMTMDASLATLDSLLRHRVLAPDAAPGIDALFAPPPAA
ncbi:DUF4743 domain-containing protein [Burkholderia plantarii]|uniref:DUF4743 domain-containing protein n=1 Tax=Burkholderia plantarii TaxID=41899 RepID=UPI0006D8BB3D|nr:DUF4743 domain-containing protein [Burkholderia plantarii]ALK31944.1 thiamin pyrophosphokinase-like protein [Burkholderia plantarii]